MREKPILFSGPMVRAILDGRKTQTRRVIAVPWKGGMRCLPYEPWYDDFHPFETHVRCPYGGVGDLLVPRTTWAAPKKYDDRRPKMIEEIDALAGVPVWSHWAGESRPDWVGKMRPGRFLPRGLWWSVPRLRVTVVRIERVQKIGNGDIEAEGVEACKGPPTPTARTRERFHALWDALNARRGHGWDVNPWVWAISFERLEKPC